MRFNFWTQICRPTQFTLGRIGGSGDLDKSGYFDLEYWS